MGKRNIVFFVDALPYNVVEREPAKAILADYSLIRQMAPSIGYSINLHQELFSGRAPDAVGYLGERRIKRDVKPYGLLGLRTAVSKLRKVAPRIDRYSRPLWNRLLKTNTQFIPLDLLDWHEESIPYPLVQDDDSLFFNGSGWDSAIADRTGLTGESADKRAMQLAWDYLHSSTKNLFVALLNIDALGHLCGNPSEEVERASLQAIEDFHSLVQVLDKRGDLGAAYLLSDHGMSNITRVIDFGIEYRIPGCGEYWMCYYDSLYFKAWAEDSVTLNIIRRELELLPGKILAPEEREALGVMSCSFGDILFVLEEGCAFAPNFFGRGVAKAYHGYVDYGEAQYGVFVSNAAASGDSPIKPLDAYMQMANSFLY